MANVCVFVCCLFDNNRGTFNVQIYDLKSKTRSFIKRRTYQNIQWAVSPVSVRHLRSGFANIIIIIYPLFRARLSNACASRKHSSNAECSYASMGIPNFMKSGRKKRSLWIIQQEKSIESHAKRANAHKSD